MTAVFDLLRGRETPGSTALHRAAYDARFEGGAVGPVFTMRPKWEHHALGVLREAAGA